MNAKTLNCMNEMVAWAKSGNPKWGAPLPKATHAAPAMIQ